MTKNKPISKKTKDNIMLNYSEKVASLDYTTEVLNKVSFKLKLEELKSIEKASIFFVTLKHFIEIEEDLIKETVLRGVGERLKDAFQDSDVVARVGLTKFGIIVYGADKSSESILKEKIKKLVSEPFIIDNVEQQIKLDCTIEVKHHPIVCL